MSYVKLETAIKLIIVFKVIDTIRNQNYRFPLVRELCECVHTRREISISYIRNLFRKKLHIDLPRLFRIKAS